MKRHLTLAIALIWILACSKPKPVKELAVMRVSEITQSQKVYHFMKAHGNVGKSIADEYFKQAESLIKTQPDKAIWNIKRAITICPQENYYRELITLLLDLHKYEEANKYLGVLVEEVYMDKQKAFVFDKPNDDDYFQYLLTNLLADPYNIPFPILSSADEQGINLNSIKERLLADERFPYKQGSMQYLEFNSWFMPEDELANYASNAENFKEFYQRLPTAGQYAIDLTTVNRFDYNGFRGEEDFSPGRMLYKSFLPEVKNQTNEYPSYNLMAGIRVNEQVVMVVYRIDSSASACPVNMRHVYYSVATYLNNGTLIDFRPVAWQAGKDVATADITPNQIITYQYKRAWKKPYDRYDFDNEVLSTVKADSKTFRITSSGKIEPEG